METSTKYETEEDIFWGFNIETELFGKHITGCEPKLFIKAQPYFDMFVMNSLKDEKTADLFKQMMLDTKDSKKITIEFRTKNEAYDNRNS